MRRLLTLLLLGWTPAVLAWALFERGDPARYEDQIRAYESADRKDPPRRGQILFVGSSSIRRWDTLAGDMAPLGTLNRGFGGAYVAHVAHFAPRIVFPYQPRAIVLYAGDNDLDSRSSKTPQDVRDDFVALLALLDKKQPGIPIYFLSIKPSPAREGVWPRQSEANALIQKVIAQHANVTYIDVASAMFDPNGAMRPELYHTDLLHLNPKGYALWTSIVQPVLERDLGSPTR